MEKTGPNITDVSDPADDNLDVIKKLQRMVRKMARDDPTIRQFYIGIASGVEFHGALKRRFDKKKQGWGITDMFSLYMSEHGPCCRVLEADLERYFQKVNQDTVKMDAAMPELLNERGGGGGRISGQPYHFVYLAVARSGKP